MSGYQYDCRESEDDFGDNKRDRRSSPPPAPSPATPGLCLWCGEKPRAATSDLYCAECDAAKSSPASDAPAPPRETVNPRCDTCGRQESEHPLRFSSDGPLHTFKTAPPEETE
jgi:hypothetical protein